MDRHSSIIATISSSIIIILLIILILLLLGAKNQGESGRYILHLDRGGMVMCDTQTGIVKVVAFASEKAFHQLGVPFEQMKALPVAHEFTEEELKQKAREELERRKKLK